MKSNLVKSTILTTSLLVGILGYSYIEPVPDTQNGTVHVGHSRSSSWPRISAEHLRRFPTCACCGGDKDRQVHHVKPFRESPELELDLSNLITLCTDGPCNLNCHFVIGHLGNTKCNNPDVRKDAEYMRQRFLSRKCD